MGRRANWNGGEVGRQAEENDEKLVVGMVETKVQLIRAPCSPLWVDYTYTMSDNKGR